MILKAAGSQGGAPQALIPEGLRALGLKALRFIGFIGSGLLSNQGEKSINFYFIRVPLRKKVLKCGTPKPRGLYGFGCRAD